VVNKTDTPIFATGVAAAVRSIASVSLPQFAYKL